MNKKIEIEKQLEELDTLIADKAVAYNELVKDLNDNKKLFLYEAFSEVNEQLENELQDENLHYEKSEINDRIQDIYDSKCKSLKSYERYIRLDRKITRLLKLKKVLEAHG